MNAAKHTPKSWHCYKDGTQWVISNGTHLIATTAGSPAHLGPGHANRDKANAHLIAAAPELLSVATNFQITGPDDDGLVWLILHGNGVSGKAMFNLGKADTVAAQVVLHLEADRRTAIAKATGEPQ